MGGTEAAAEPLCTARMLNWCEKHSSSCSTPTTFLRHDILVLATSDESCPLRLRNTYDSPLSRSTTRNFENVWGKERTEKTENGVGAHSASRAAVKKTVESGQHSLCRRPLLSLPAQALLHHTAEDAQLRNISEDARTFLPGVGLLPGSRGHNVLILPLLHSIMSCMASQLTAGSSGHWRHCLYSTILAGARDTRTTADGGTETEGRSLLQDAQH